MVVAELILGSLSAALVPLGLVQLLLESEGLGWGASLLSCGRMLAETPRPSK